MAKKKQQPDPPVPVRIEYMPLAELRRHPRNPKNHDSGAIGASIERFGFTSPPLIDETTGLLAAGHGRLDQLQTMKDAGAKAPERITVDPATGNWLVPVVRGLAFKNEKELEAYLIADNRTTELGGWLTPELLRILQEQADAGTLEGTGFNPDDLARILESMQPPPEPDQAGARRTLAEDFLIPPFSILDTRQGYWQARKAAWLALGIESHIGRGENLLKMSETVLEPDPAKRKARFDQTASKTSGLAFGMTMHPYDGTDPQTAASGAGTSIFDPVLCELAYRWFVPAGGRVLDPFAGGSVRGIVAEFLGYKYTGIDLRKEQVEANRAQADKLKIGPPQWVCANSLELGAYAEKAVIPAEYDFIFSCPPYYDLEQYSDDEADLSNAKDYRAFLDIYRPIIVAAVALLKPDRFACFVVGDIRDKVGFYRNFVGSTIEAFERAGATLYNYAILVNTVGSLPVRIRRQVEGFRKLGKCHQDVLVFYKGDPRKIPEHFPLLKVPDVFAEPEPAAAAEGEK
jgi:DNA modification methylase